VPQKLKSLRSSAEFGVLRERGRREQVGPITITFCSEGASFSLAYAIPKRVGGAVVRNRLRRRLRAIFASADDLAPGMYLIGVAPEAATMTFQELRTMVSSAITKVTRP
jgi:ribonuclease P protein component